MCEIEQKCLNASRSHFSVPCCVAVVLSALTVYLWILAIQVRFDNFSHWASAIKREADVHAGLVEQQSFRSSKFEKNLRASFQTLLPLEEIIVKFVLRW